MATIVSIVKVTFTANYKGCHRLFWKRVGDTEYEGPVYANPECSGEGNPCSISFSESITIPNPVMIGTISNASTIALFPNVLIQFTTTDPHGVPLGTNITANICTVDPDYYNKKNATLLANTANTFLVAYNGTGPVPAYVADGYIRKVTDVGTLYYEGYIQACCEDENSTEGRVPWTASYTPNIC